MNDQLDTPSTFDVTVHFIQQVFFLEIYKPTVCCDDCNYLVTFLTF